MIDSTYYTGTYYVAGLDSNSSGSNVLAELNILITRYEKEFLQLLFGPSMYLEYVADTNTGASIPATGKWHDLLEGIAAGYTDRQGQLQLWPGMLQTSPKISAIAIYIYTKYLESKISNTSISGEKQIVVENANNVALTAKIVTNWNEMVELNRAIDNFLVSQMSGSTYVWQNYIDYKNNRTYWDWNGPIYTRFKELFNFKNSLGF